MLVITNIKTSRIPNRVNLVFSDQSYLPFLIDDVIKLSLTKNSPIDQSKLDLILNASLKYLGIEYALRQIAISPKTEKILTFKLKQFFKKTTQKFKLFSGYSYLATVEGIVSELNSKNLLNPANFVFYFINKNKSKSKSQIKFLLARQGIDISQFNLDQTLPDNDLSAITKFLSKKKITSKDIANFNAKSKIYASLFRRGFQMSDIKAAIDDYLKLK